MSIGILGGGLSGIALQRALERDSEVLEKQDRPGGLCRTFWKNGFGYDIGGHILYTKLEAVQNLIGEALGDNINRCRRANKILHNGRYVKYPFENDLATLDLQTRYECLIGYLKADYPKPSNLEEWAYYTFGKGIAEHYLLPYNRKIWNIEPAEMALEWVERIPRPPMEDVVKSALGIETEGYTHQLYFKYPLRGGIEAFFQALVKDEAKIRTGFDIRTIRKTNGGWRVSDGENTRDYEEIVITYPVTRAIEALENVPDPVRNAAKGLRSNAVRVVMVAVNNESLLDKSAVYIPDPDVLAHRVCFMGFFSPNVVQPGTSSLIAEITTNPGDGIHETSDAALMERVVDDLHRIGILDRADVIETDAMSVTYGYPVYDLAYAENRKIVHEYFDSLGIPLLGRFAQWDYINMDEVIRRALELAKYMNVKNGQSVLQP